MKEVYSKKYFFKLLLVTIIFFFCVKTSFAQPALPQRTITVQATQPIDFGQFVVTGPGTITVNFDGTRTATGGVIIVSSSIPQPAIFEIKLCLGRTVTIDYDTSVMITGTNGGQLELIIGPTEKGISGDEFPVENNCDFVTVLRVGGKLVVPTGAIPGIYSGSFPMSFTQQ